MTQTMPADAGTQRWVPDDSTFGMRLAMIRQWMRWVNVAEAARECGVPTDSWRNWEEGMEPRRMATIAITIATRTGCDLDWLQYGPARKEAADLRSPTKRYGLSNIPEMIEWSTELAAVPPMPRHVPRPRDTRPPGRPPTTRPATSTRPTVQTLRDMSRLALANRTVTP